MDNVDIPEILQSKSVLFTDKLGTLDHPLYSIAQRLLYASDYANRQVEQLKTLLQEDDCEAGLMKEDYRSLVGLIPLHVSGPVFSRSIRHFRHRHLLRLLLRELANRASTEETMKAWSDCADALIIRTVQYCHLLLASRHGKPCHASGEEAELYIIAMGKLGGQELNFSSDIDLICAFSAAGYTDGELSISNEQYFTKIIQQLIQLLQNISADGFVFRVDLRLRPNGDSGPLVYTLAAMETYYQEQGRDWERYAMVKARPLNLGTNWQWFHRLITPFVYRRYVDFSVIESLRSMQTMIEREIRLNPMLDDIKRGCGGIREVEFVIQCFQLMRGGRMPQIQHQNAITALAALKRGGLLAHSQAIQYAYLFLRKLENALQMQNDQQTHSLPQDPVKQAQLAMVMNFKNWVDLVKKLNQYQRIISRAFHAVLYKVDGGVYQDEKRLLANQLISLWQGHLEPNMAVGLLTSLGFSQAERCYQMIHAFRQSPRCRRLSQAVRIRLDHFMVLLLCELKQVKETDAVLLQALKLLENIVGRSAYLALLTENPLVLHELLYWFARSPFITGLLVQQPFLLEVLVDQKHTWRPPRKGQLANLLKSRLIHSELDMQDEILRQFKLSCWLLAARAEFYHQCKAVRVGQFLADVAEVIIAEVLTIACRQLSVRYPEIMQVKSRFAIIAYGKLGSREMNYDSDVDLVFLHTAQPEDEALITRLTQKILHMLTTRLQTGILYSVDTRLRPSGAAGLLVSHLDAYVDYQLNNAWTWEHQALLRARVLSASQKIRTVFYRLKKNILFSPKDQSKLKKDVISMRAKMGAPMGCNPIKHNAGGLLDLEFLVQFLVLANPSSALVHCTNTLLQLQHLQAKMVLSGLQFSILKRAYQDYHTALHQGLLQTTSFISKHQQSEVLAISHLFL